MKEAALEGYKRPVKKKAATIDIERKKAYYRFTPASS